jgi:SprT-like family.
MNFTELELNKLAKHFAKVCFGLELNIPVELNGRLSICLGYFQYNNKSKLPIKIVISKEVNEHYKPTSTLDTLLHEITHWACFVRNKPYSDGDDFFESELKRIGASSTGSTSIVGKFYRIVCCKCGKLVATPRKEKTAFRYINKNYVSTCCGEKLKFDKLVFVEDDFEVSEKMKKHYEEALFILNKKNENEYIEKTTERTIVKQDINEDSVLIVPGKRGVTNAQMIPAIEKYVKNNDKNSLIKLKEKYPTVFESSKKYIKKSLQFRFYQLIG